MKNIFRILPFAVCLALCGCDEIEDYVPGPQADPSAANVYFASATQLYEIPATGELVAELKVYRLNKSGSVTKTITTENVDTSVFTDVPTSVTFADGQSEATLSLPCPNIELGESYTMTFTIQDAELTSPYAAGVISTDLTVSIEIEWEDYGQVIYQDGTFSAFWAVDPGEVWYVNAQKFEAASGEVRYRLINPYNTVPTAQDSNGILDGGHPDNYPEDILSDLVYMIVKVKSADDVEMDTFSIGVDWGYGSMSIGMSNTYTGTTDYPVGYYQNNIITFPANSIYLYRPDRGAALSPNPTIIYLSLDAYINR